MLSRLPNRKTYSIRQHRKLNMRNYRLTHFKFSLLFIAILLSACSTTTVIKPVDSTAQTTVEDELIAKNYELDQQWDLAEEMYRYLVARTVQPDRSRYLQKVALMLYRAGRFDEIEAYYQTLQDDELIGDDIIHRDVLLSGVYFQNGKTYQSLGNLPELDDILAPEYKALALNIRSLGVLAIGKPLESAMLRIEIGKHLQTDMEIRENHEFIWDALHRITETNIIKALSQPQDDTLRGWLELNLIARRSNMLPEKIEPWIGQWHDLYWGHEASLSFADILLNESRLIYIDPDRIALLLPFSDKLANVAKAIQNGFLYAYYNDPEEKPQLEIVNVSSDPVDFSLQYNQAIQNGADFIVGPLDKKLVNELLISDSLRVPTLTLNYADDGSYGINNLYQFGLRPEDEAEQIADYALVSGLYHAVTLTPNTRLGDRLKNAFSERFEALGGQVVDSASYQAKKNDYSKSIKQLLNLTGSEKRHSLIQQITGTKSEFIPRRRQDVDMVFISGNPRQARLIKPQLKFHHAKDLPVYTTSGISSSITDENADRDLNEILYVDTPWALNSSESEDFQRISGMWPKLSQRYAKFFALGIDAYQLIPSLRRLMINPGENVALNTGTISVDNKGRIHRELMLATYEKGLARLLKESVESIDEDSVTNGE